jgi:hypothetical protein
VSKQEENYQRRSLNPMQSTQQQQPVGVGVGGGWGQNYPPSQSQMEKVSQSQFVGVKAGGGGNGGFNAYNKLMQQPMRLPPQSLPISSPSSSSMPQMASSHQPTHNPFQYPPNREQLPPGLRDYDNYYPSSHPTLSHHERSPFPPQEQIRNQPQPHQYPDKNNIWAGSRLFFCFYLSS